MTYLPYILLALLVVFAFWPSRKFSVALTALVAAGIARLTVKPLILLFIQRERPYGGEFDSFPSGHALFFFALATVVYLHNKRWGLVFFAGAVLMGIARVWGGIHWPSDVVGGALMGILIGWLVDYCYARFCHKS